MIDDKREIRKMINKFIPNKLSQLPPPKGGGLYPSNPQ